MTSTSELRRTILVWCPDWPVLAAATELGLDDQAPLALTEKSRVFACSPTARSEGVRRGMRIREAHSRCTGLTVLPYDPVLDHRAFEPFVQTLEEITPGVQLVRPGLCAIRARGPRRYYGSEESAAEAILSRLAELGVADARIGIADGLFASELAAKHSGAPLSVVPSGEAARFLAPLPLDTLETETVGPHSGPPGRGEDLVFLLRRLGVRTLGALAALPREDVAARFGPDGARAHLLAAGRETETVIPRLPPERLDRSLEFEPPLDRIDQVTFAFRVSAEEFVARLTRAQLVVTALRIEVASDRGDISSRSWLHPRWFTAGDVLDRVRWQLQGSGAIDAGLRSPIARIAVIPETVDAIGHHEEGLWGTAPEERVHHGVSRVQSMLGHESVVTVAIAGGRALRERQQLIPWGDREPGDSRPRARPWPGSLPPPLPPTVFAEPPSVLVRGPDGERVAVDERGSLSSIPSFFTSEGSSSRLEPIAAWAGPWPIDERWWDPHTATRYDRFQVVDSTGVGWLLLCLDGEWAAEARYD
ncbi:MULTISPECIES: DNA polymerase Y family protein [unclassified Rathayibacter]|uniref:DNA polymerase Y family protein n=1 Tax=unclassified Rathayibacter TaxID=2609250 RepID=UPI00188A16D0|nr:MULTISPECIES: DNA polymerase Y family protein [unclassified Rathayibacter]MBF4462347.1 DNA polymerase Y family protein [Rathayibacter sp. VKM Ac-2879]MBF4503610.1 DNA polymerase Y family protein [Rathayibacter sp. VKM Ac-2878]